MSVSPGTAAVREVIVVVVALALCDSQGSVLLLPFLLELLDETADRIIISGIALDSPRRWTRVFP